MGKVDGKHRSRSRKRMEEYISTSKNEYPNDGEETAPLCGPGSKTKPKQNITEVVPEENSKLDSENSGIEVVSPPSTPKCNPRRRISTVTTATIYDSHSDVKLLHETDKGYRSR